jgi:hypothetical protein
MKRLATLALLGIAMLAPTMIVGCGEETKPADASKPAEKPAEKPADAKP